MIWRWIRDLFCRHQWETIAEYETFSAWRGEKIPLGRAYDVRCKRCGWIRQVGPR